MNKDLVFETIKVYDDFAKDYAENWNDWESQDFYASKFLSYLKGNKILDVGCGPGRDAKYFVSKGFDYTGLELSKEMLKLAKQTEPRAKYVFADMRKMPFNDNEFDGVWGIASLVHIPKNEIIIVLNEINRVLKFNGIVFLTIKLGESEGFELNPKYGEKPRFFSYFSKKEFEDLLLKCNFRILELFLSEPNESKKSLNTWINVFAIKK